FELISILLVITAYVWFISYGLWTRWPSLGNSFYDRQATSFLDKKLYIEAKPNAALLALPNPYDPAARRYLDYLMDYSLYKGRYYLYFGPVPALFLAFIKLLGFVDIGDQHLVFAFASGIFVIQSLLIIKIKEL